MAEASDVLALCRARGWRIVTAESCTGGLLAARLTNEAGASDVLDSGFVTYSYASKEALLGVSAMSLAAHGAVSQDVVSEMARGALNRRPEATLALAISGVAGPGGSEEKPEGLVWFALMQRGQKVVTIGHQFGPIGRANVRQKAVETALEMIAQAAELPP